jgi:hypothetical protein
MGDALLPTPKVGVVENRIRMRSLSVWLPVYEKVSSRQATHPASGHNVVFPMGAAFRLPSAIHLTHRANTVGRMVLYFHSTMMVGIHAPLVAAHPDDMGRRNILMGSSYLNT